MVGSTLTRFKQTQRFLLFDFEAESLNLFASRPWEVAYALCTQKQIISIKADYIWWPDLRVSRGAAAKTRFNEMEYKAKARPAREVLDEFEKHLLDPTIIPVGHSILGYDAYMHRNWRREVGLPCDWSWLMRLMDTNCLVKGILKGWTPDISSPMAYSAWQYRAANHIEKGLKSNLGDTGRAWKIEHDYTTLHRAESDITLNHKVLAEALFKIEV